MLDIDRIDARACGSLDFRCVGDRANPVFPMSRTENRERTSMRVNDRTNWELRLAGEVVPIHDSEPDYGFYRVRSRDKTTWRTVAYWCDADGALRCLLDGQALDEPRACELWTWACQHPITHEVYTSVRAGGAWADLNEVVTRSNNAPADNSFEALQERIDDLAREAERLIKKGAAQTQDEADQAADVANKLGELRATADKAREHEKAPHLQAGRDVDNRWRPIIGAADIYARLKDVVCKPFLAGLKAAKDRAEAEARRKAEDAARAAREAEVEAQRKASEAARNGDAASAQAAEKAKADADAQAQAAAAASQRAADVASRPVTAGTRGRSVGLRGKTVITIEDRAAVLAYFADRPEVTELLQTLAERAVRAGIVVPGVKSDKESKAA